MLKLGSLMSRANTTRLLRQKQQKMCHAIGGSWCIMNPASSWPRYSRAVLYGKNDMAAGKPHLVSMAARQLAKPLYLIQVRTDSGFILPYPLRASAAEHQLFNVLLLLHQSLDLFAL